MGSTSRYSFFDVNRYYTPFYYQLVPGSFDRKTGAYSVDVINPLSGTEYLNYNEGPKQVSSTFHLQSILNYNRIFGEKHSIGGLLVYLMRNYLEGNARSEEHTSDLQSLMRISYAVFCLKKKNYK